MHGIFLKSEYISLTWNHLPLIAVGSNPARDFYLANQLAYGTSDVHSCLK